jgi:para-nitrobenzyl esterase
MKKTMLLLFTLTTCIQLFSQHPTCDGNRYRQDVFANVTTSTNIQYGQNYTLNNVQQNLIMDIAQPVGDFAPKRPLLIYIHGGAFIGGDRSEGTNFCLAFARKGFVTATIDYRLVDVPLATADSLTLAEGLIQAISDAKAAIRFFVQDAATANTYRVDTNYIFLSGLSAGAITANHVAYLDPTDNIPSYFLNLITNNGGFSGNSSTNTSHTTPVRGVINASGALWRNEWMSAGEPAIYSAHDNLDSIVPCGYGLSAAFSFPVYLQGSCIMQQEANAKGIYNEIFINNSNGHGAYLLSSPLVDTVVQQMTDFLYLLICTNTVSVNESAASSSSFQLSPNPATETIIISFPENKSGNQLVQIYNATGILVREYSVSPSGAISVSDLAAGLYFVQVKAEPAYAGKFVKK